MQRTLTALMAGFVSVQQEMQFIVNEPDRERRQVLLDDHIKRMQPYMEMCRNMTKNDISTTGLHGNRQPFPTPDKT